MLAALASGAHGASLRFLVMGDWGGQGKAPYTEAGQRQAAEGMGHVAGALGAQFGFGLGDNFYSAGIPTDEHDARFRETFEDVYTAPSLQIPFYMVVGNHDHGGNVTAQVAYSQHSARWRMPGLWYSFSQHFEAESTSRTITVDFVMIDTVTLSGNTDDNRNPFDQPPGPANPLRADDQWTFIEQQLAASKADYLWVGGHYPGTCAVCQSLSVAAHILSMLWYRTVWSGCSHGPTKKLVDKLKPLLIKYGATGYMCGHDHCQSYIVDEKIHYVLTGNGDNCCYKVH
jgi:hypothetical protein